MTSESSARPPLDTERLAGSNPDLPAGIAVEVVKETGSTNALLTTRAREGAPEWHVVVAEHQTAGRGRLDRVWHTPARTALTFSVLLRPVLPLASWPWLSLLTGRTVREVLAGSGYPAAVKWPNDVLLGEQKVAGILLERVETASGPAAVVGIGINVAMTREELPVPEATSLAVADPDRVPDRTGLLIAVLARLHRDYGAWQTGGETAAPQLADSYAAACATLGRRVRVQLPSGEVLTGTATGVDEYGRLVVGEQAVSVGDVVHVRLDSVT